MTLLVLLIVATATAGAVGTLTWRWAGGAGSAAPSTMGKAREAGAAIRRHPRHGTALATRLDAQTATGLGLTLALLVIVGGGALFAVLAYLVRGNADLIRLDNSVANWGDRHASPVSTDGLNALTHLGEPVVVVGLAAVLAVMETVRTRSRWVVPFLCIVVAGNGILTTTVKDLADRVRPALNPIAETLGPSFPSGHSSWAAAFFAAAALLLSRGRGTHARAAIAGVAAGLAVMVAGTRVLLDVHWLSDVIAGLALGLAWFSICAIAFGGRLLRFGAAADEAARVADATTVDAHSSASPRATSNVSPSVSFRGQTFDDRGHADSIGHEPRESADR
jgi:membrane-associated phospholipid phosphatase